MVEVCTGKSVYTSILFIVWHWRRSSEPSRRPAQTNKIVPKAVINAIKVGTKHIHNGKIMCAKLNEFGTEPGSN